MATEYSAALFICTCPTDEWYVVGVQYYVAPDGRGTVDDVSRKLRDGCPSYYNESDYQFYQAVECLEKAAGTSDAEERDRLAKEALDLLSRVPETADLLSVCQRFEGIRYPFGSEFDVSDVYSLCPRGFVSVSLYAREQGMR